VSNSHRNAMLRSAPASALATALLIKGLNQKENTLVVTRLQIGASRLEYLDPNVLETFLDKTWVHLGEEQPKQEYSTGDSQRSLSEGDALYSRTNFVEFYYRKGDILQFDDSSIDYIFSEHFFEHLFLDEALSLLEECCRILKPFGVMRTCVPDADLRTYEPPEPAGFPDIRLPYTDPAKHKTRWSAYSLSEAVRIAGFEPMPLRYCNTSGQYICVDPSDNRKAYAHCPDLEMVLDLSYISRIDSLIIDGIKKPSN